MVGQQQTSAKTLAVFPTPQYIRLTFSLNGLSVR